MRLRRVSWRNFRRLNDGDLTVRQHLVLVGPNEAGKSSVLRAVHLCLGVAQPQLANVLIPRDFSDPDAPLSVTVELADLTESERAAFPDELDLAADPFLQIALEAQLDPSGIETMSVRRYFPLAGHGRSPSRTQLQTIRWSFVSATRSLAYELGPAAGGAARSLLRTIDLDNDEAALKGAMHAFEQALAEAPSLVGFRDRLASALSDALPRDISASDLHLQTPPVAQDNPLADVVITLLEADQFTPIADQSDGIRSLALLTLLSVTHEESSIVAIDEPELHLHTAAQRTVGRLLASSQNQQLLATHSAAIVSCFAPGDIVALGPDRSVRQLPEDNPFMRPERAARHWSHRLLDPLTAASLILVEGPADRLICTSVATILGFDLDRRGIHVFELDSADFLGTARDLFGPTGLDVAHCGLVDADHRVAWAEELGVAEDNLEAAGFYTAIPDLEGMYVSELGVERTIELLLKSGRVSEETILKSCAVPALDAITTEQLAEFCRSKRRKVLAAIAISHALTEEDAARLPLLKSLLGRACDEQ